MKHGQIQEGVRALASTIEALCQANLGEDETMAQVQQKLQKAASVTSDLEARVGATEVLQEQIKTMAERMQWTSEQVIQEAKTLQATQQATTEELRQNVEEMAQKVREQSSQMLFQAQMTKAE